MTYQRSELLVQLKYNELNIVERAEEKYGKNRKENDVRSSKGQRKSEMLKK